VGAHRRTVTLRPRPVAGQARSAWRPDGVQTGSVTTPPFPLSWFDRHEPAVELAHVGMSRRDAESAAEVDGVAQVRILEVPARPDAALTADLRPGRLNLLIDDGRVVRAAFF